MAIGEGGALAPVNGADLYYEIDDHPGGEPLLLLHGGTGCGGDWAHAGHARLAPAYRLVRPDARGHGRSTNPAGLFSHRQFALDALALLDHLKIDRCKAIGVSMGANTLLHLATIQPDRMSAMVAVSSAMHFSEQARAVMRAVSPDDQPASAWEMMRRRHKLGDAQIRALWGFARTLGESTDDMNFTADDLAAITARTLIVYGDRDFLYPVEMGVALHRAIRGSALWVVPGGGHGPVFGPAADRFVDVALEFLRDGSQ